MGDESARGDRASFTRGAEIWMHQLRLLLVAMRNAIIFGTLLGFISGGVYFHQVSAVEDRYFLKQHAIARLRSELGLTTGLMRLRMDGAERVLTVALVAALAAPRASEGRRHAWNALVVGSTSSAATMFLVAFYWWRYGKAKMADRFIRGASLVTGKQLKAKMEARSDVSPYSFAGVPIRAKAETLHTAIVGAQGTGKSQQFFAIMKQVRARGMRMFVYDPTGEFTAAFYREGKDILMNPLDARSPNWNVWNEVSTDYHYDNLANGLIPEPAGYDPFWALAGRMVFKDAVKVLGAQGRRTNRALYESIAKSNLDQLYELLKGTAGATYVDPVSERTGMSLKMTVQNQLESFRFLHDEGEKFSIRDWVHQESDSWMFITARESMREALKPVLTMWIDIAIKAVLDLDPIHRERLWFSIDELPTLQKLDILKLALTNTRKYGLCMILGIQNLSQLYEIYGENLARTIISGCQTKLLLRVTDASEAKLLAELIGPAEFMQKEESVSYGLAAERDGVSISARRVMRDIVLSSEILTLPDMTGYLLTPGDYPAARVSFDYVPTPSIASGFQERGGFGVTFSDIASASRNPSTGGPASPDGTASSKKRGSRKQASPYDDL